MSEHFEKLKQSSFFQAIFESNPYPMWIADKDGIIRKINKALMDSFGLDKDTITGNYNVLKDRNIIKQGKMHLVESVFKEKKTVRFSMELEAGLADGLDFEGRDALFIDITLYPIIDDNKKLINVAGHWIDLTEHKKTQKDLRKSQKKLETTLLSIGDAVIATDVNGKITRINKVAQQLTGYNKEEAIGRNLSDVFHIINGKTRKPAINPFVKVIVNGKTVGLANDTILLSKKDKEYQIADSAAPIKDENDDIIGVVLVFRDVTDEYEMQKKLKENKKRLESLYNSMNEGLCLHEVIYNDEGKSINYRIIDVNPKYEEILDVSKSDVVGKMATDVYETDKAPFLDKYSKIAVTGESENFEKYFAPLDKYFDISAFKFGKDRFATVFFDITDRKKSAQSLKKAYQQLNRSQRVSKVGSWEMDLETGMLDWSDEAYRIFGMQVGSDVDYAEFLDRIHLDDKDIVDKAWSKALETGDYDIEHRIVVDGEVKWVHEKAFVNFDDNGIPHDVVGSVQDITKQKEAEDTLKRSEQKFRSYIENAPNGIFVADANGNYTEVNRAASEITGYSKDELLEMNVVDLIPENYQDKALQQFAGLKKHVRMPLNIPFKKKNGEIGFWIVDPIKLDEDTYLGFASDITKLKEAQEALQKSKERFQLAIEGTEDGLWDWNIETGEVFLSKRYARMLGYEPGEIKHDFETWNNLVHEDDYAKAMKAAQDYIAGKTPKYEIRVRMKTKDGSYRWNKCRGKCLFDENGNPKRFIGFNTDITKQKEAEEKLRQSERKFRLTFDTSPDAINLNRLIDGLYMDINQGFTELTGFTREDVIGKTSADIRIWYDMKDRQELVRGLKENGYYQNLEAKFRRKDGSVTTALMSARVIELDGEKHIISITRDISERKAAENALRESQKRFEEMTNLLPQTVWEADLQGNFTYVNKTGIELMGYKEDFDISRTINIRDIIAPEDQERAFTNIKSMLAQNTINSHEYFALKKNGTKFPILVYSSPIIKDYKPVGIRGITIDMTELKEAEKEKERLEKKLRRSQKLETIGTLAGGIAHDFNNILSPIMGYAEMGLLELKPEVSLYDDLKNILDGANRARDLVKQILTFSKQAEKERKPLNLSIVLNEAIKLLRSSIPSTIKIRKIIDENVPQISADATQMHQVIMNLCTNAAQAMDKEGGLLTIELKEIDIDSQMVKTHVNLERNSYIRLTVKDTGIGMDNNTLDRIFEPFFTTKEVDKGTGMGLSTVYGIIRGHKGEITVYSEPGSGSVFHVYLPTIENNNISQKKEKVAFQRGTESVLIIDDEPTITDMTSKFLTRIGYTVETKNSSLYALKEFRKNPDKYDILITDLTMPEMTGINLAQEVNKLSHSIPILIMTGYSESLNNETLKMYGIQKVIEKPINLKALSILLRRVLGD